MLMRCIGNFSALDPFRRHLERPSNHQRNWETDYCQEYYQPDRPVWNFKKRKNLRGDLNDQPTHDRVRDGDFVNVSPLQLGEEISFTHSISLRRAFGNVDRRG